MRLDDLIKPMEEQTDEELMAKLQAIRKNRMTIRPAAKAHEKKEQKKGATTRISAAEKLLAGMTPEQRAAILAQIGEGKK